MAGRARVRIPVFDGSTGAMRLPPGATVNIFAPGTTTPVTLYLADTGGTTATNPITVNAYGEALAYADPQRVDIRIQAPGLATRTLADVDLEPAAADIVRLDAAQTVTAKTMPGLALSGATGSLSSPTITTPAISGGTLTGAAITATGAALTSPTLTQPNYAGPWFSPESYTVNTTPGTTDMTTAIQAALTAAMAVGGTMVLKATRYRCGLIDATDGFGFHVVGERGTTSSGPSYFGTLLQPSSACDNAHAWWDFTGSTFVTIDGVQFGVGGDYGSGGTPSASSPEVGLLWATKLGSSVQTEGLTMRHCYMTGSFKKSHLVIHGASNNRFYECQFYNYYGAACAGAYVSVGNYLNVQGQFDSIASQPAISENNTFINCEFHDLRYASGSTVSTAFGLLLDGARETTLINCEGAGSYAHVGIHNGNAGTPWGVRGLYMYNCRWRKTGSAGSGTIPSYVLRIESTELARNIHMVGARADIGNAADSSFVWLTSGAKINGLVMDGLDLGDAAESIFGSATYALYQGGSGAADGITNARINAGGLNVTLNGDLAASVDIKNYGTLTLSGVDPAYGMRGNAQKGNSVIAAGGRLFGPLGSLVAYLADVATQVNYLWIACGGTGVNPRIAAESDTNPNIPLELYGKGTGGVKMGTLAPGGTTYQKDQLYRDTLVNAYASFSGATPSTGLYKHNVSSITRSAQGTYAVALGVSFTDLNYRVLVSYEHTAMLFWRVDRASKAVNQFSLLFSSDQAGASLVDPNVVHVEAKGILA